MSQKIKVIEEAVELSRGLTREKSFCPKSLMINDSANGGNIYLRESA
jgi:hypothetical protein